MSAERQAYAKMIGGLAVAIEGATELGVHRGDGRWAKVAVLITQIRENVIKLGTRRLH